MNAPDTVFELIMWLLGGLALFIFGMRTMSEGLSNAVGDGMRTLLGKATQSRISGVGLGTVIGFSVQSSAAVVLFVGFINAGLMSLMQSIGPMMGANIGTTLSMQLISFKLTDYCMIPIILGLILHLSSRNSKLQNMGLAFMGFGTLFLGMSLMSSSIRPYREAFEPFLALINGNSLSGLLVGTLVAALITGIVQSSGAVIGMGFAMISAGIITDLSGIFPIVIGANIGTCVTGLLGSIGTTIDARRIAIAHLLFNILSTAMAIAAAPLFYRYIPLTSGDLIHQAANANTLKMLMSTLLLLPVVPAFGRLVIKIVPSRTPQPAPSYLDVSLYNRPEQAIFACLRELQRTSMLCAESLHLAAEEFIQHTPARLRAIKMNEQSVNKIKVAMRDYLAMLTQHYLSKRQAILIEHIDRCMSDLERVGDHIDNLADIAKRQRGITSARFCPAAIEDWLSVFRALEALLACVIQSLDPEAANFQELAKEILRLREAFNKTALSAQDAHFQRLEAKTATPIAGIIFNDYLSNFWRISKHIKSIALAEQQPQFWLKHQKLGEVMSTEAPGYAMPEAINPSDYLDTLQSENYH